MTTEEKNNSANKTRITWEPSVAEMIRQRVFASRESCSSPEIEGRPFMVGVVGIPGAGKTISSFILESLLTDRKSDGSSADKDYGNCDDEDSSEEEKKSGLTTDGGRICAVVVPMDGYHYPLKVLRTFPDADDAVYRRGSPDTFDAAALKHDLQRIRSSHENVIGVPGFDHAKGDPEPNAHIFRRDEHNVIICEGLYLLHDEDGWNGVSDEFDLIVFVSADIDKCIDRVKIRNRCLPGYTPEEIDIRCDIVDRSNAETVMDSKSRADIVVESSAF